MLEVLLELLFEILFEIGTVGGTEEILRALGLPGVDEHEHERGRGHLALALATCVVAGAVVGGLSVWLFPMRVVSPGPVRGVSLVVGPLMAGFAMHLWGRFLRTRHHATTYLATFTGGSALGLGIALVRFVWIK